MATQGPRQPRAACRSHATVDISTAADGLSDTVPLGGLTLSSIQMSTAWTSARLAFLGSVDNSTNLGEILQSTDSFTGSTAATAVVFFTTASRVIVFPPDLWHGIDRLQIASINTGTTAAVAQAATRTLKLGLSEVTKRS